MAERSVFVSKDVFPYFEEKHVEFDWFGGFALSQKRKCEIGLHQNFLMEYPEEKVLEISSTSLYRLGTLLSAMSLSKRTPDGVRVLESVFQGSRVYGKGDDRVGPFTDCYELSGRESKKVVKERAGGRHSYEFIFYIMTFYTPSHHLTQFYDFLYLNALLEPENEAVRKQLLEGGYTAFTDLATKSLNCQARSCAIFVGLVKAGKIDMVRDYETYLELFRTTRDGKATGPESYENVQLLTKKGVQLLSPVVPCRFHKEDVGKYYEEVCGGLTNKKSVDNFL